MAKTFKATVSGASKNPALFGNDVIVITEQVFEAEDQKEAEGKARVLREKFQRHFLRLAIFVTLTEI